MITGVVTAEREAMIRLRICDRHEREHEFDAAIDTGFNGFLTLPAALVESLGLPFAGPTSAILGDGNAVQLSVFEGRVILDDREVGIDVLAAGGGALAGMSLLQGFELRVEVVEGGRVTLERMA